MKESSFSTKNSQSSLEYQKQWLPFVTARSPQRCFWRPSQPPSPPRAVSNLARLLDDKLTMSRWATSSMVLWLAGGTTRQTDRGPVARARARLRGSLSRAVQSPLCDIIMRAGEKQRLRLLLVAGWGGGGLKWRDIVFSFVSCSLTHARVPSRPLFATPTVLSQAARSAKRARVFAITRGFWGKRKNCYKIAKRAAKKALEDATIGRKLKKRDMRKVGPPSQKYCHHPLNETLGTSLATVRIHRV